MNPVLSISKNSITALFSLNESPLTIRSESPFFNTAIQAVKDKDWLTLRNSFSLKNMVAYFTSGEVIITDDNKVYFKNKLISNYITQRILEMLNQNLPIEPLTAFLNKVMLNPSKEMQEELLQFLETTGSPITDDGDFLAYRRVRDDYKSFNANLDGTFNLNRIGDINTMKPEDVDFNRNNVCSRGLHFCAFSYLSEYYRGQGKIMVVKINPKNVACFPTDYNKAKGRCLEYTVVAEVVENKEDEDLLKNKLLYSVSASGIKHYSFRDVNGRFAKAPKN